jgi:hypothetical protein
LANGVVVSINFNDDVEIFHKRLDKPDVKVMRDPNVDFDMKLCKIGGSVHFIDNHELFKMRMK